MAGNTVIVTDKTFADDVLTSEKPVLVDFWATWCGPCKMVAPVLEEIAAENPDKITVAKLDIDANAVGNALLQAVKSQGIPTVVAFRDGQPVSMFIGAYPEEEVNRFVDELVTSEAELEAELRATKRKLRRARAQLRAARSGLPEQLERTIARARAEHLTYLKPENLRALARAVREIEEDGLPGLMIEAGAARGGSAIVLDAEHQDPWRKLLAGTGLHARKIGGVYVYDVGGTLGSCRSRSGRRGASPTCLTQPRTKRRSASSARSPRRMTTRAT